MRGWRTSRYARVSNYSVALSPIRNRQYKGWWLYKSGLGPSQMDSTNQLCGLFGQGDGGKLISCPQKLTQQTEPASDDRVRVMN